MIARPNGAPDTGARRLSLTMSHQVFDTECADCRRRLEAALKYREREGNPQVPYDHTEGPYPSVGAALRPTPHLPRRTDERPARRLSACA